MNARSSSKCLNRIFKRNFSEKTFYAKDLQITKSTTPLEKPSKSSKQIPFGTINTDHMLEIDYINGKWKAPKISPYHNLSINPMNAMIHYSVNLFEGMKAFKTEDNKINLFRPEINMKRMNDGADRVTLPNFEGEELIECLKHLVRLDYEWIPKNRGFSMYIRPTFISMTNQLGLTPSRDAKLFVIMCPVGPYFPQGYKGVDIVCNDESIITRAGNGGFGHVKLGSNYGPMLQYYKEIISEGYQQVLWLNDDIVEEVGVMNFFLYWINKEGEKELITCNLNGHILPGVIRQSVIELAKKWGIKISEREFKIQELIEAVDEGRVLESFGTGNAAVICPIKTMTYKGKRYSMQKSNEDNFGILGGKLYEHLLDLQYGVIKDHPWVTSIDI